MSRFFAKLVLSAAVVAMAVLAIGQLPRGLVAPDDNIAHFSGGIVIDSPIGPREKIAMTLPSQDAGAPSTKATNAP